MSATRVRPPVHRRTRDERGSASFFAIAMMITAITFVTFLVDASRLFAEYRKASAAASAGSRAGAASYDAAALATGQRTVDSGLAVANANSAASAVGLTPNSVVVGCGAAGCNRVTVTVSSTVGLVFFGSRTVTVTQTARVATGVSGEGR